MPNSESVEQNESNIQQFFTNLGLTIGSNPVANRAVNRVIQMIPGTDTRGARVFTCIRNAYALGLPLPTKEEAKTAFAEGLKLTQSEAQHIEALRKAGLDLLRIPREQAGLFVDIVRALPEDAAPAS